MKARLQPVLAALAIAALLAALGLIFIAWRNGGMVGVQLQMSVC